MSILTSKILKTIKDLKNYLISSSVKEFEETEGSLVYTIDNTTWKEVSPINDITVNGDSVIVDKIAEIELDASNTAFTSNIPSPTAEDDPLPINKDNVRDALDEVAIRNQETLNTISSLGNTVQTIGEDVTLLQTDTTLLSNTLKGVNVTLISGVMLSTVIEGTTSVSKSLFPVGQTFSPQKTLVYDIVGSVGVYSRDIDENTVEFITVTMGYTPPQPAVLLGEIADYTSLPPTVSDIYTLWGITPNIGDYVRILDDEEYGGGKTERAIVAIDGEENITWGNAVPVAHGDFQEKTTDQMAGLVLIGGDPAGTFGEAKSIDIIPTENSTNLINSHAVWEETQDVVRSDDTVKKHITLSYNEYITLKELEEIDSNTVYNVINDPLDMTHSASFIPNYAGIDITNRFTVLTGTESWINNQGDGFVRFRIQRASNDWCELAINGVTVLNTSFSQTTVEKHTMSSIFPVKRGDVISVKITGTALAIELNYIPPVTIFPETINTAYTHAEIGTGKLWHNGKIIYRRCFTGTITTESAINTVLIPPNIVETIVSYGGMWCYDSTENRYISLGAGAQTGLEGYLAITTQGFLLRTVSFNIRTNAPYDIWVEYTKKAT